MYRCQACGTASRPGAARLTHVLWKRGRPRQVAAEVPVCRSCHAALADGVEWQAIIASKFVPEPVQPEVELTPEPSAEPQPLPVQAVLTGKPSPREAILQRMRGNQRIL